MFSYSEASSELASLFGAIFGRGDPDEPDWSLALCKEVYPEYWFPTVLDDNGETAKSICARCPILDACREYAIARPELEGIWGGTTHRQRCQIRTARRRGQAA